MAVIVNPAHPLQGPNRPRNSVSGYGWPTFAAPRAAKAKSSPTSSPIFPKNSQYAANSGCHRAFRRASRPQSEPRAIELVHHWLHKGGIVLHFAGIDSISAAEKLIGLVVAIPRTERAPLAEDEAYIGDLIGCTLIDVAIRQPDADRRN